MDLYSRYPFLETERVRTRTVDIVYPDQVRDVRLGGLTTLELLLPLFVRPGEGRLIESTHMRFDFAWEGAVVGVGPVQVVRPSRRNRLLPCVSRE